MALDLVFGRTRRNFGRDLVGAVPLPTPDLSSKAILEQQIKADVAERPAKRPSDQLILERAREAAPETMKLYDKYRPTYKDHQVVLRMKTDLLGP